MKPIPDEDYVAAAMHVNRAIDERFSRPHVSAQPCMEMLRKARAVLDKNDALGSGPMVDPLTGREFTVATPGTPRMLAMCRAITVEWLRKKK